MAESSTDTHKSELQRLLAFLALSVLAGGLTYVLPGTSRLQPWQSGEPLPLVHLLSAGSRVAVDSYGELATESDPAAATGNEPESANDDFQRGSQQPGMGGMGSAEGADFGPPAPEDRPPATATPIDLVPGSLDTFFSALAELDADERDELVRVMHWGDSTIAADGITGQVRRRLQSRFGDGGPGFLAIEVDPRWGMRPGIVRSHEGEWSTQTITFAGAAEDRYGLAGTVSTAEEAASVLMGGLRIEGKRQLLHRFDVHYQSRPGAGSFELRPGAGSRTEHSSASEAVVDRYVTHTSASGTRTLRIATLGDGPVTLYGVALETKGPGITWECLGVAGSSIASMLGRQQRKHMAGQVSRRKPSLLVYQTGGNELTYPSLIKGQGKGYQISYLKALTKLRAGKPDAPCILVGPLDQAMRKRGKVVSKPDLDRMIAVQRRAAAAEGCSFWDSRHAMGGKGGFGRWLQHKPAYAWTDLMHLSLPGLDLVGDTFTDALLHAYEQWRFAQGLGPSPQPEDDAAEGSPAAEAPPSEAGGAQQAGPGVDPTPGRPAPPQSDPPATGIRAD